MNNKTNTNKKLMYFYHVNSLKKQKNTGVDKPK